MAAAGATPTPAQRMQMVTRLIPPGRVASYGQVADLAGLPGRARSVGRALGSDADRDTLPWFRVLCADGRIAFAPGSDAFIEQRERLQAEGVSVRGGRVDMTQFRWRPSLADLAFGLPF